MWILPSHTSVYAQDTEVSTSASDESLASACERLLTVKSKPSRASYFSRAWRAGNLMRLRSGLICGLSRGKSSAESGSSRVAFPASRFQQQESEPPTPIQDTCSHTSSTGSGEADLPLFSWRTSKASSRPSSKATAGPTPPALRFCSMSSENWSAWVTEQRRDYSRRQSMRERLTSERGSLSSAVEMKISGESVTLLDQEDYEKVNRWKWKKHSAGYAYRTVRNGKGWKNLYLHRLVLSAPEGVEVDHINQNKLDNRKSNLRLVSRWQNAHNRVMRENNSGHPGVRSPRNNGRWQARIYKQGKCHHLGTFSTVGEAVMAYNKAAEELEIPVQANAKMMWPTASARDSKGGYQGGRIRNGKLSMDTLDVAVQAYREGGILGPPVRASRSMTGNRPESCWATPNAGDGKAGMAVGRKQKSLGQDVSQAEGGYLVKAKLNPRFVEALMGLSIGWLMPSCARPVIPAGTSFALPETVWCPSAPNLLSEICLNE